MGAACSTTAVGNSRSKTHNLVLLSDRLDIISFLNKTLVRGNFLEDFVGSSGPFAFPDSARAIYVGQPQFINSSKIMNLQRAI
jgi:hypothetical protein